MNRPVHRIQGVGAALRRRMPVTDAVRLRAGARLPRLHSFERQAMSAFCWLLRRGPKLARASGRQRANLTVEPQGLTLKQAPHAARMHDSTVYFVWTCATEKPINLGRSVNELLRTEVAQSAAWPSEDTIRLPPSTAAIDRRTAELRLLTGLNEQTSTWAGLLKASVIHPRAMAQLLTFAIKSRDRRGDTSSSDVVDPDSSLEATFSNLDAFLLDIQKVSVAERTLDARLFGGEAQAADHYVRLILRSTRHTLKLGDLETETTIEPRVLLHQDGIVQVCVGVNLPTELSTEALIAASLPNSQYIAQSQIPEPFSAAHDNWVGGQWSTGLDGGVRVREIDHEDNASVYDYLELVVGRVLALMKAKQQGEWNCYPIVMAQPSDCCEDWINNHHEDLVQLLGRSPSSPYRRLDMPLGRNFSVRSDHAFYVTSASALIVNWRAWKPGIRDLEFTMLLEHALSVYVRLRKLEYQVRHSRDRPRGEDVLRGRRSALQLANEARGAAIRYGSARDIAKSLLADLGANEIRTSIDQGLSMMSEQTALRTSDRSSRRADRLTIIGVLVAAVAAIPSLPALLELVAEQRRSNPDATAWSIFQVLSSSPQQLAATVTIVAVAYISGTLAAIAARSLWHLLRLRKRGYASRLTGYRVIVNADTESGDESAGY